MNKRYSKKREAIADCLKNTTSHPDAEWIYNQLKERYPDLSLGTVYRNLNEMKDNGNVISVGVYNDKEHFDGCTLPHAHAICTSCGKIVDLPASCMPENFGACVQEASGFTVSCIRLCYVGKCENCQKKETAYE